MVLKYMYNEQVCSIIDVDYERKTIHVTNFVKDSLMRAFGKNENPSWEDFQFFLERRCIPKTRDKLKWHLKELGVDFYDPLTIILKTQGRMSEDHFWIDVEDFEKKINKTIEEKDDI